MQYEGIMCCYLLLLAVNVICQWQYYCLACMHCFRYRYFILIKLLNFISLSRLPVISIILSPFMLYVKDYVVSTYIHLK